MIMQMVSVMQVIIIDKYAGHKTIVIASCTYRLYKWETKVLALAALVLQGWLFSAGCTSCPNQGTFFATIIMAHLLVCSIAHLPRVWSVLQLSWTPSWRCAHRSTPSLSCPTLQSNKCRIPTFFFPCQNSAQSWCQMVLASQHGLIEIKDLQ